MSEPQEMLDVTTASSYLKLHHTTVREMAAKGELPAFKIRSEWRFRRADLEAWIEVRVGRQRKLSVLVVEDIEAMREYLRMLLEEEGCVPLTASNGREALELMKNTVPEVVVLDLKMPVMNGPQTLKQMRRTYGDIPVVIVTAYADTDLMAQALEWSPFTVIQKGVDPERFIAAVRAAAASRVPIGATFGEAVRT